MEVKFNSLFDNDVKQNETNFYHVDTVDTTLLLSNLVLGEDTGKSEAVQKLGERNFGNYPNYLLSGRPCATKMMSSKKFCDSSGWPESPYSNLQILVKCHFHQIHKEETQIYGQEILN